MQQVILDEISFFVLNLQEICKIKAVGEMDEKQFKSA